MSTLEENTALTDLQTERSAITKAMISTVNSTASATGKIHDPLLVDIRAEFKDAALTLVTMSDEQVGLYFFPKTPNDAEAIADKQRVLVYWDALHHAATSGSSKMPPLVNN